MGDLKSAKSSITGCTDLLYGVYHLYALQSIIHNTKIYNIPHSIQWDKDGHILGLYFEPVPPTSYQQALQTDLLRALVETV